MKINEKGTNLSITPEIRDYLYKKLEHLKKFIQGAEANALAEVELGKISNHHKSGDIFRAEINLHLAGENWRAVSEQSDLLAAIDIAKDEMVRELQSGKDKRVSLLRRGGARVKGLLKSIFIRD